MRRTATYIFRSGAACLLLTSGLAVAQTAPAQSAPPTGGWRRASDPPPAAQSQNDVPIAQPQNNSAEPVDRADAYGQPGAMPLGQQPSAPPQAASRPAYGLPAQVTIKPGTYTTIRVNEELASNKNKAGDLFTGSLAQPIIVDGIVVANRGQGIVGRVAEVGKENGVHKLRLELTGITLADGTQTPVQSKLVTTQGRTTPGGAQAGTVVGTTALGAGIGAVAGWGTGAAIGAGAGAAVGLVGVLATRNHPSIVYPETALTFEITSPVPVVTANAPQAYRYVGPEDYQRLVAPQPTLRAVRPAPPYYYGGYYAPYYASPYPYYWGPSIGIGFGVRRGGFRRW